MSAVTDNATAHKAADYEAEVGRTIPFNAEILRTAIDVALAVVPAPKTWLDTGCGPGTLVELAKARAPKCEFWLADPSDAMLAIARARHAGAHFFGVTTQDLPDAGPFDVITAIQCHHYGDVDARMRALARCRELLAPGGVFVTFENVRAESDEGQAVQRKRWADFMRAAGRDEATVEKALAREGTAFFPIRVSEHLALFARAGFSRVEIVWRAYGQAGFYSQWPGTQM